jgi:hypothetical protein
VTFSLSRNKTYHERNQFGQHEAQKKYMMEHHKSIYEQDVQECFEAWKKGIEKCIRSLNGASFE